MVSTNFIELFPVEESEVRFVPGNTPGRFNHVVTKIAVSGLAHAIIFRMEITGVILIPHYAGIFSQFAVVRETLDGSDLGKNACSINRSDARN